MEINDTNKLMATLKLIGQQSKMMLIRMQQKQNNGSKSRYTKRKNEKSLCIIALMIIYALILNT
jgi:hypothetical protein